MTTRAAEELLYDSETTLRLVDTVLDELQLMEEEFTRPEDRGREFFPHGLGAEAGIADLPAILLQAHGEIQNVLDSLRASRNVLERAAVDEIHHRNGRVAEVTSVTEIAATDILDGVERALALVDGPDAMDDPAARAELRSELFGVVECLQVQDVTSQQLSYASGVLNDMERRLAQLATVLDPARFGMAPSIRQIPRMGLVAIEPAVISRDAARRQALADEIFGR